MGSLARTARRRGEATPHPTEVSRPVGGRTALVLAGGPPDGDAPLALAAVPVAGLVVAADSGLHLAQRMGLSVDVVVGDLDSVDGAALAEAAGDGTRVEAHPADKDASDLELAIEAAVARGCDRVVVLGLHGGRLDHHLAGVLLLASPRWRDVRVEALGPPGRIVVVHDDATVHGEVGALCTLLPVGGPARGVRTTGLRWALDGDDLEPGTTRGLSNELVAPVATVSVSAGTLLVVLPATGTGGAG